MTEALSALARDTLRTRLRRGDLRLGVGPFTVRLRSGLAGFADWLEQLYSDYPATSPDGFADFDVRIDAPSLLRRWWRPQAQFSLDGEYPFKPLPVSQAAPFFEWGLNWCIAQRAHQYLIVHAAVVERDGRALVMPGGPGVGKSTLCAGLVARGWRLLSDELALIRPGEGRIDPVPRPVALKNASIEVVRAFAPQASVGPLCRDTAKGTVAHMGPPAASIARARVPATATWFVFPRYAAGAEVVLEPRPPEDTLAALVDNAFNYSVQGRRGFHAIADLATGCPAWDCTYGDLESACAALAALAAANERPEAAVDQRV